MTWHEARYSVAHDPDAPPRSALRIETADRDEVAAWLRDVAERIAPTPAGPRADVDVETRLIRCLRDELAATRAAVKASDAEVKRLKAHRDDEREQLAADYLRSINTLTMQLHDARRELDEALRAVDSTGQNVPARPLSATESQDQATDRGTDGQERQNGSEAAPCVTCADLRDHLATALSGFDYARRRLFAIGRFLNDDADVFVADHSNPIDGVRELARRAVTAEAQRKADVQTLERWAPVVEAAKTWWNAAYGEDGDEQRALGQAVTKLNAAEDGHG